MNEELKIIIKAVTDGAKKGVNDVKKELEGLSGTAKSAGAKVGTAMKAIGKAAIAAVATIAAVGTALVALGKSTLQFNKEQAKLITAFQASGSSAEQASKTYQDLYRYLGDSSKAVEAANHLAKITTNEQNLAEWTKITQGIYASFGDSLPIEGLTEAANETIRVGKVTGTLADALNWAGVSEDEFNAKLATTNSLEEREAMLRDTLNGLYNEAAEIYERNNQALLDYNASQARLDTTMAQAGSAIMPLMTALNNLGSAFFTALKPAIDAIIPPLVTFINWITKAIETVMSFFSALTGKSTSIKAVGEITEATASAAKSAGNLGAGMSGAEKAAQGAAKAAEEAKRSTQGFDELNIVADNSKSASGGSGGGGGGSASPGYASGAGGGVTGNFATEVEETGGIAGGVVEKIKEAFAGLKNVFAPSIDAWSGAIETIKTSWNNAKPDFINGAKEIKQGFSTLGSYIFKDFIPTFVNSFSVNLAPVFGDIIGFVIEEFGKLFSWLGEKIKIVIDDVAIPALERIKGTSKDTFEIIGNAWNEHGENLKAAFSDFFENLRGHFDNFYNKVFKPIWDKVLVVFDKVWKDGLKPLVDKIVNAFMEIATELTIFYNEVIAPIVDWIIEKILPPIVKVINVIIEIVGKLFTSISNIIGGIVDVIKGIIKFIVGVFTGDWQKAWDGIKDIFSGFWDAIKGIFSLIWDILSGIAEFIVEVVAAAFSIAWELIKTVWSAVVSFFQAIWDGICAVFSAVVDWFSGIFTAAWDGIKNAWNSVGDWFSGIWDKISGAFKGVKDFFKNAFSSAWEAIKNVFSNVGSFFSGIWDKIKNTFSAIGTKIGDAISGAVKKGINGVIGMIEKIINGGINLINGAINLINKIPGVSIGKISKLSLPRLAKGGIVDTATIAMIGERGKEAVVPLENNTEWMDKLADRLSERNKAPSKIVLMLDGKELGWANIHSINDITKQTGALQLQLA